jgi:hypothetical protein
MKFFQTARFYQLASDKDIAKYETSLDRDDHVQARKIVENFFWSASPVDVTAKKQPDYLELPPEPGDVVLVLDTNHYARLLAISDDKEFALVKEEWGAYPTRYKNLRRTR